MKRGNNVALWAVAAALLSIALASACQPPAAVESTRPPPSALPAPTATVAGPPTTAGQEAIRSSQEVEFLAREDLAERLDVAPEAIAVHSVEAATWPDAGLGCPEPGRGYAQVLTPGFRVVLEAGDRSYEYHTDQTETIVLCTEEGLPVQELPLPGPVESGLEALVERAREDLAARLSIAVEQIEVIEARSVVWPDASLGCPQPGMRYRQVPMDGALIRLEAGGQVYAYHSGGGRGPFLCEQPPKEQKDTPLPPLDLLRLTPGSPNQ